MIDFEGGDSWRTPGEDLLQAMLQEAKQAKAEDADNDGVRDAADKESIAEAPSPLRRFCKMARNAVRFASWKVCHSIHEMFSKLTEQSSLPASNVWQMVLDSLKEQAKESGYEQQLEAALVDATNVPDNAKKTLIITDKFCLQHAGFQNYANVQERVLQKDSQPENAERLMVLIDSNTGCLTQAQEFKQSSRVTIQEVSTSATISDALRIHDYRYIKRVIRKCEELYRIKNSEGEAENCIDRFDNDSFVSA